ncbi:MAG: hypothetical protein ACPGVK_00320 [Halocynthiibacter sp.]
MFIKDPFEPLGLKSSDATEADVKRAYAKHLKETRPDEDPEAFMALRNAFTQARNIARANDKSPKPETIVPTEDDTVVPSEIGDVTGKDDVEQNPTEPLEGVVKYWFDETLNYHFNSSPYGKLVEQFIRWVKSDTPTDPDPLLAELASAPILHDHLQFRQFQELLLNTIFWDAQGDKHFDDYDIDATPSITRPAWLTDQAILAIQKHFDLLGYIPEQLWQGHRINVAIALFTPVLTTHGVLDVQPRMHDTLDLFEKEETKYRTDDHGSYFDREQRQWIDKSPVSQAMRDIADLVKISLVGAGEAKWRDILERDELQMIDEHRDLDARLVNYICQETGLWADDTSPKKCNWLSKDVVLLLDDTFGWSHQFGRHMHERRQYDWIHRIIERHRVLPNLGQGFKPKSDYVTQPASQSHNATKDDTGFFVRWLFRPWSLFLIYIGIRLLYAFTGSS